MTQFRVLPIRYGDAYLVRGSRGGYLVDGGGPEGGLAAMLADRRTRGLRAAVCSLPTPGRLCGLLELMEAGYPVAEYWLPEGLESLAGAASRFDGDWAGWRREVLGREGAGCGSTGLAEQESGSKSGGLSRDARGRHSRLRGAAMLVALAASLEEDAAARVARWASGMADEAGVVRFLCRILAVLADRMQPWPGGPGPAPPLSRLFALAGQRMLAGRGPADLAMLCGRLLLARSKGSKHGPMQRNMALAAMAAARLDGLGARLRFFQPVPWLEDRLVPRHPVKCLNGVEVSPLADLPVEVSPAGLARRVRRLTEPDNSLVFVYGDARCGALLCGGTRLRFLDSSESVRLDRPTVVAAPRRGAATAERAYPFIVSGDPWRDVWVRGYLPPTRKVARSFEAQRTKVCLNNCRTLAMQEVLLVFEGGRWNREAGDDCLHGLRTGWNKG
ncbi:hypothetical protein [Pseudodesulfovibrio pelocollis]|uniref:hypothetical protein n=1 Tax=Pseudodesulfovibrio pelocollis TaxID=3051432 RepID=UPI00255ABD50|nr:hypothetical protein [Pseudodesulfovibrio sp. SB368]